MKIIDCSALQSPREAPLSQGREAAGLEKLFYSLAGVVLALEAKKHYDT